MIPLLPSTSPKLGQSNFFSFFWGDFVAPVVPSAVVPVRWGGEWARLPDVPPESGRPKIWWHVSKQWHEPWPGMPVLSGPSPRSYYTTGILADASNSKWLGFQKGMGDLKDQSSIQCFRSQQEGFQGLLISMWMTPRDPGRHPHKAASSSHFGCQHRLCWELELSPRLQSPWCT